MLQVLVCPYTWRSCLVLGAAGGLCPAPAMWVWILAMMYSELATETGILLRSGIWTCCWSCSVRLKSWAGSGCS